MFGVETILILKRNQNYQFFRLQGELSKLIEKDRISTNPLMINRVEFKEHILPQ